MGEAGWALLAVRASTGVEEKLKISVAAVDDGDGGSAMVAHTTGAREVEEAGALTPDLEEKLSIGVTMVEGGVRGDVHAAGARQGGPTPRA